MPLAKINGVNLYYELKGNSGEPIVFIHGSWGDHHSWDAVSDLLSKDFRVLSYDRRGHSQSERLNPQGNTDDDMKDLTTLIEHLGLAPAHIAGNSFGALLTLKTAFKRPDIFRTLIVNEPPLISLLEDGPDASRILPELNKRFDAVLSLLKKEDNEAGAHLFMETVAGGPGYWSQLTPEMQQKYTFNAPTWQDEMNDPEWNKIDLNKLKQFSKPALVTHGEISPAFFKLIVDKIIKVLTNVTPHTYSGAGHGPHSSHPAEYVSRVRKFISENS